MLHVRESVPTNISSKFFETLNLPMQNPYCDHINFDQCKLELFLRYIGALTAIMEYFIHITTMINIISTIQSLPISKYTTVFYVILPVLLCEIRKTTLTTNLTLPSRIPINIKPFLKARIVIFPYKFCKEEITIRMSQ